MSIFSRVQSQLLPRHDFNVSHRNLLSLNQGYLVPIFCEETMPGDVWRIQNSIFMRYASLLAPVMSEAYVSCHWFNVPWFDIWNDYAKWETGGSSGDLDVILPYMNLSADGNGNGSLADYLGVTVPPTGTLKVNALPFRAYQLIYNYWYRDENLEDEVNIDMNSGQVSDAGVLTLLRKRCWEKDYFTSALPWTQKGGDVDAPVSFQSSNLVTSTPDISESVDSYYLVNQREGISDASTIESDTYQIGISNPISVGSYGRFKLDGNNLGDKSHTVYFSGSAEQKHRHTVDISSARGSIDILELYRSIALQKYRQIKATAGTRLNEFIKGIFGVRIDDQSNHIPQYIGGSRQPVVISEVLQTAEGSSDPVGTQYGHAMSVGGDYIKHYCKDRGYIMGIMSVIPRTYYQQGTRRMFLKSDKYDFATPQFANIGEQPIWNNEIYSVGADANGYDTFGYTPRYAEYKYIPSGVHGDFKGNLSYWHQGRIFDKAPVLNKSFVESDPSSRIFAVDEGSTTDENQKLYSLVQFKCKVKRTLPYFGTPHI